MPSKDTKFGLVELYCGASGKIGYYNSQEIGLARALKKLGYDCYIFYPDPKKAELSEERIEDDITVTADAGRSISDFPRELRIL